MPRVKGSGQPRGGTKLLLFEIQHAVVICPQLGIAEDGLGADYQPEPRRRVWIVQIKIRMVDLDGLAEGLLDSFDITIRADVEHVIKRLHHRMLGDEKVSTAESTAYAELQKPINFFSER
jgi:hypothetical protein